MFGTILHLELYFLDFTCYISGGFSRKLLTGNVADAEYILYGYSPSQTV